MTRAEIVACQENARKSPSDSGSEEALWEIAMQVFQLNCNVVVLINELREAE